MKLMKKIPIYSWYDGEWMDMKQYIEKATAEIMMKEYGDEIVDTTDS
jgi:hypothetical protein